MQSDDKARPLAERIPGLDARSSYRDIRDGIGRGATRGLSDQDLAAALGMIRNEATIKGGNKTPRSCVWALETYYGSSLRHEHALRAAWAEHSERTSDPIEDRIRNRVAAAVAIRQFAGGSPSSPDWAHMVAMGTKEFDRNVWRVLSWLEEHREGGLAALRRICAEPLDISR